MYETLKWVHVAAVIASGVGFFARGVLNLSGSRLVATGVMRVAPHVVDTVLLGSAIAMAVIARLSPLAHSWLAAKIVALIAYIVVGAIALRPGRPWALRLAAFAAAVVVFLYIVGTALTRDPLSWLAMIS